MAETIKPTWDYYTKKAAQLMRDYVPGEDLTGVSVSDEDAPEAGGMVAVNPDNPSDKWYVAKAFFRANYQYSGPFLGSVE